MKKSPLIFILIFSIVSCKTMQPLEKELQENLIPKYQEQISPIITPINAEYRSTTFDFNRTGVIKISASKDGKIINDTEYLKINGRSKIEELGDKLIWNINVTSLVQNKQYITHNLPILSVRLLTNKRGKIEQIETSTPALVASNIDKDTINKIKNILEESWKSYHHSLPEQPLISGDVIAKITNTEFEEMFNEFSDDTTVAGNAEFVVDGWGYYNNSKVIVASVDKILDVKARLVDPIGHELKMKIKIIGYSLIDSQTFIALFTKFLISLNTQPDEIINLSLQIAWEEVIKIK